jgi:predicted nucleotidyltransferase
MLGGIAMPVSFDLNAITTKLVEAYSPKAVYMFGSFAWGIPNFDSDLDLLIVVEKSNEKFYKRAIRAYSVLRDLNIPKDVIVLTSEEFSRDAEHPATLAYRIRNDGVKLYGVA